MENTRHTIVKNISSLMAAQIITWALALILTVFLPRYLGAANVGKLQLGNSIWGIMTLFITFGMDILLTKEIARTPEKTSELIGTSTIVRLTFFCISFGIVSIYVRVVNYPVETIQVINIVGISMFINALSGSFLSALQGLERMEYYSLSDVISKAVATVLTIILLIMGYSVIMVAYMMLTGSLVAIAIQIFAVQKFQKLKFTFSQPKTVWMLKNAFPYLLVAGFLTIYTQLDVIILSLLVNEESIGWYSAASRLFGTLLFIPTVFITAIFPVLSRMYSDGSSNLHKLFQKSFDLLLLLSIPIGLGVFVIAQPVVLLLYGDGFRNSGPILALMGIVLIFTFLNTLFGRFFISIDQQNKWTAVMAVATIVTIPLDLVLVPWCDNQFGNGAIGGSLSFLITECGMLVAGLIMLPKNILSKNNIWYVLRTILAGGTMAGVAWQLRDKFLLIPVAAGGLVYLVMVLLLRLIPHEDWALLQSVGQNILGKFRKKKNEISV
ncbi:MAG: flippase [Anaerolineales bacterium]|nr:flippase [Anaerolineales bacterium]